MGGSAAGVMQQPELRWDNRRCSGARVPRQQQRHGDCGVEVPQRSVWDDRQLQRRWPSVWDMGYGHRPGREEFMDVEAVRRPRERQEGEGGVPAGGEVTLFCLREREGP